MNLERIVSRVKDRENYFLDLVDKRESTRNFSDKPVERELVKRCIEAGRLAPSACNSQPWRFHLIENKDLRKELAQATLQKGTGLNKFVLTAPMLVVITVDKGNLRTKVGQMISGLPYYLIDVGIVAEHFCLQATEVGLGTCMIGWFNEKRIKELIQMNRDERIALLIAVGYPSEDKKRHKARKSLEDIMVVYE